jgi:hypothetical protein
MDDLLYLLVGPAIVGFIAFMYTMTREWKSLTTEEIFALWDANAEKFGNVEEFGRALERAIQEKNT